MRRRISALIAAILWALVLGRGNTPSGHAQTVSIPIWSGCITHLDTGRTHCDAWAMVAHAGQHVYSTWHGTRWITRNLRVDVQSYPIFRAPAPKPAVTLPVMSGGCTQAAYARITGYSPADTPGQYGADGTHVYYGMVAASSWIPFGARVYIPSLGTVFTVHDRGAAWAFGGNLHFDVWEPTYQQAIAVTGYERVYLCG